MGKTVSSINSSVKKQFGFFFNELPSDLRASSRRVQFYGCLVLENLAETDCYKNDPLLGTKGASALKNALKFYNIGVSGISPSVVGATDLDGSTDEYRTHVGNGIALFNKTVDVEQLNEDDAFYWSVLRNILAEHHEKWDGTGYPKGSVGGQISLAARICSVCSAFDTYTTSSADRDRMTSEAAFEIIQKHSDTYYDPVVVNALGRSIDKINQSVENGVLARASAGRKSLRPIEQMYRTVYDYGNRLTYGYETDIRLNDKKLGVIESKLFIPVAEKSSKINELVKWSVENVCETVTSLKKRGRFTGMIFIPVSVKALIKKNFISNISRIINGYDLSFENFCFMVSENMLSLQIEKSTAAINELRGRGFSVAVDGFGSEYANLSSLQNLEIDYIMLSPEFTQGILESTQSKKLTEAVIELANKLDIAVIADGVAVKEQAEALFAMGCNLMRGTRFGRFGSPTEI